jgi:HK97 family phage portal protein
MGIVNRIKSVFGLNSSYNSPFIWDWERPGVWNTKQQLQQYRRLVYSVVGAIAQDVAKIEFIVQREGRTEPTTLDKHPFLQLVRRPNRDTSQFQLIEFTQTYIELAGEAFWYLVKGKRSREPQEIYLLRPDMVDVVVDRVEKNPRGLVSGYVLRKDDGTKIPFDEDEVIHFKTPNPINPYRGLGVIEASATYIQTEEFASEWTKNSIFNSGRPSGIVNIKGLMDPEQFELVKRRFKQEYSGTSNAGKTMFLTAKDGIEYQKLGMDLGEVAIKDLKDLTRDDIFQMFRVSKTMMGITDDVNRANAREQRAVWIENVIKPKMNRIVDTLDSQLIDTWGPNLTLTFKDPTPVWIADKVTEWTAASNKWMTTNEIRAERNELLGSNLKDLEGGDELYQPLNLVPLSDAALPPTEPEKGPNGPQNEPQSPSEGKPEPKPKPEGKSLDEPEVKEITRSEKGEIFRKELFTHQERWEKKYQQTVNKVFNEQKDEILKRNQKAFEEWTFDTVRSKKLFNLLLLPLTEELMKEQAGVALSTAGDSETEFQITQKIRSYIEERIDRFADSTDQITIDALTKTIAEGVQNGDSVAKLRKKVEEVYNHATSVRSEMIARSETIAASNQAALEAYHQSPVVAAQEWFAEPDCCEFCAGLDGKTVGLSSNFANLGEMVEGKDGGMYNIDYMDLTHPPLHPNCRCAILPVAGAEFAKALKNQYKVMDRRTKEARGLLKEIQVWETQ